MEINFKLSFSDILAIIGAITGISSVLWNFVQWKMNQAKLVVSAKIVTKIHNGYVEHNILLISMINKRKIPININGIGGKNTEGDFIIVPSNLPKILHESEEVREISRLENYIDSNKGKEILELFAYDNLNRTWKVDKNQVDEINQFIKKLS